jgi:hypothetical protein
VQFSTVQTGGIAVRIDYFIILATAVTLVTLGGLLLMLREPGEPDYDTPLETEKVAEETFEANPPEYAPRVTVTPPAKPDTARVIDEAVSRALSWLAMAQKKSGSWDDEVDKYDAGVTALALLAFMESGSTPNDGMYSGWVANGFDYLLRQQDKEGRFGHVDTESWIYNHAIALLAVARAYGLTKEDIYAKAAKRGAKYLFEAQNPGLGWKYEPRDSHNDTSVTSWVTLALKEAAKHGIVEADRAVFMSALDWLDRVTNTAGKAGYMRPGDDGSVLRDVNDDYAKYPSSTAGALVCRHLCGQSRRDRKVALGMKVVFSEPAEWFMGERERIDYYFAFWVSTAAKMLVPVKRRAEWTSRLASSILAMQEETGKDAGSFHPWGKWCMIGGRAYSTAMCTLALLNLRPEPGSDSFKLTVTKHRLKRPEERPDVPPEDLSAEEKRRKAEEQMNRVLSAMAEDGGPSTIEELAQQLINTHVTVHFNDTALRLAVGFLVDISKIYFGMSEKIPEDNMLTLRARNIPLSEVLSAICLSIEDIDYGLDSTDRGLPFVVISTVEDISRRQLKKPEKYINQIDCSSLKAKLVDHPCPFGLSHEELTQVAAMEEKLELYVTLDESVSTFGQLKAFFESSSGFSISFEPGLKGVPPDTDTIKTRTGKRSLDSLLGTIRSITERYYVLTPNGISFVPDEKHAAMWLYAQHCRLHSLLRFASESNTVSLSLKETALPDFASFVHDTTHITIVLSSGVWGNAEDYVITYECKSVPWCQALTDICDKLDLTWEFRGSFILIKTRSE